MLKDQDYIVWNPANVKVFNTSKTRLIKAQRKPLDAVPVAKPSIYVNYPFSTEH